MKTYPFLEQEELFGAEVNLEEDSPRGRLAKSYFNKLLFEYFEQLAAGASGWGTNFHGFLFFRGWNHLRGKKFVRIRSAEEE